MKQAASISLGELCSFEKGTSAIMRTEPGQYPMVVTAERRKTADTWQIEGPAVCIPLVSSTGHGDASLHRVIYQEGRFALSNLLVALKVKDERKCYPHYLYYLLMARKNDLLVPLMRGTSNVALKTDDIQRVLIPLPPLAAQRRLVARIEALAGLITEAQALRKEAVEVAEALAFSRTSQVFDALVGAPAYPIKILGVGGENPVQTGPFGAQLHASEFVDEGCPVLNVGNVWPSGLRLDRLDHVLPGKAEQLKRYAVKGGDLLFARSGATLGKVCLVPDECDGWLMTGHLFRVRFDPERVDNRFAFAALRAASSVREQVFGTIRGATRPGFNTTLLSSVKLPLPDLAIQRSIVRELTALQAEVDGLKRLQAETQAALDALLPAVLEGVFKQNPTEAYPELDVELGMAAEP